MIREAKHRSKVVNYEVYGESPSHDHYAEIARPAPSREPRFPTKFFVRGSGEQPPPQASRKVKGVWRGAYDGCKKEGVRDWRTQPQRRRNASEGLRVAYERAYNLGFASGVDGGRL